VSLASLPGFYLYALLAAAAMLAALEAEVRILYCLAGGVFCGAGGGVTPAK